MIKCKLQTYDYNSLYEIQLGEKEQLFSHSYNKIDTLDNSVLTVSKWETPTINSCLINYKSNKCLDIITDINSETVILSFLRKGEITYCCDILNTLELKANTNKIFYTPNTRIKQTIKGTYCECFNVFLPKDYVDSIRFLYPNIFDHVLSSLQKQNSKQLEDKYLFTTLEMNRIIEQVLHCQTMKSLAPLYFHTKIQELLALQLYQFNIQLCNDRPCRKYYFDRILEAKTIIENKFQNPPRIQELSNMVGISETLLKIEFKRILGKTIYNYLTDYKMNIAIQLLNSNLTINEISEQLGYTYHAHFTTAFKRFFRITPSRYREQNITSN